MPAVERAIRVLRALRDGRGRRLSDLSRELGLSKSTLSELLATLEEHDLVERDPGTRAYRLGLGLVELGGAALRRLDLVEAARPHLARLRDGTGETAILHVPSGAEAVIVDRAESDHQLKLVAPVGHRLPPFAGSVAKVFLAALPGEEAGALLDGRPLPVYTPASITSRRSYLRELARVRRDGYAVDDEEYLPGVRAVSAPILNGERRAVGALSVVGASGRLTDERLGAAAAAVVAAARELSEGGRHG